MVKMTRYFLLLLPLAFFVSGCDAFGFLETQRETIKTEAPIATTKSTYSADETSRKVELEIPFVYRNQTGEEVYLGRCSGVHEPRLEKRVDGKWIPAYRETEKMCLEEPAEVEAGGTYEHALNVEASKEPNTYPSFEAREIPGTYRLVWDYVYGQWNGEELRDLVPQEDRVSNEFEITAGD